MSVKDRGFREAVNRMEVFRNIAEALNRANDASGAMDAILPRLGEALGLKTAWAFRFDESRRQFVEVGASGLPPALNENHQQALRCDWCECQSEFVRGELGEAVNIVRCSRLKSAKGDAGNLHFHASIPLRSKGKPLGILNLAAPGPAIFSAEALHFLQTVGQQVAVAMDRARMLRRERDRADHLHRLAQIAGAWWSGPTPAEKMLQRALEAYVSAFGYEACGVVAVAGSVGDQGHEAEADVSVIAVAEAKASMVDALGPYVYPPDDAPEFPPVECESILLAGAKSALSLPLPLTGYQLRLESTGHYAFDDADGELLRAFAWQVAAAYVSAQAHAQEMRHAHLAERNRIAADLHDSVSQRLFSASLLLRTAFAELEKTNSLATPTVARVLELISESQGEMRDFIRALRRIDDDTSLAEELRSRVCTLSMQQGIQVVFLPPEIPYVEPAPHVRVALLAILDEALHNALSHAKAKRIVVRIINQRFQLCIRVEDDGIGCKETDIGKGLGTRTMFERAAAIHGSLTILGLEGAGTCVEVMVPSGISKE